VQNSSASPSADPFHLVLIGPGGTGKGTVAKRLIERDQHLWLSRSWTTRAPRNGEDEGAYVFVSKEEFEDQIDRGGFVEWAEFLGNYYGTPVPSAPHGHDVLLEIEVQGAEQVKDQIPEATVILLVPPSEDAQIERLRGRGDPEPKVAERVAKGREEVARGRLIASHEVVNDDLESAVEEVLGILEDLRSARSSAVPPTSGRRNPMANKRMTLMDPPIEELFDKVDSKFTLVTLGAKRAREINAYYQGLGEMLGRVVPPQVTSVSGKPLSIAFEEVAKSKVAYHRPTEEELAAEAAAAADAEAAGFLVDPFGDVGMGSDATVTEMILSSNDPDVEDVVVDVVDVVEEIEVDGVTEVVEEKVLVVDDQVVAEEVIVEEVSDESVADVEIVEETTTEEG
jgi:guanylate kinase